MLTTSFRDTVPGGPLEASPFALTGRQSLSRESLRRVQARKAQAAGADVPDPYARPISPLGPSRPERATSGQRAAYMGPRPASMEPTVSPLKYDPAPVGFPEERGRHTDAAVLAKQCEVRRRARRRGSASS